jgi:hypothetical protein
MDEAENWIEHTSNDKPMKFPRFYLAKMSDGRVIPAQNIFSWQRTGSDHPIAYMKLYDSVLEELFRNMCVSHDLTHMYSDDGSVYRRGREQLMNIREAAKELPDGMAKRVWNETVDSKIAEGYREQFYWRYPEK